MLGWRQAYGKKIHHLRLVLVPAAVIVLAGSGIAATFSVDLAAMGAWLLAIGAMAIAGWHRKPPAGIAAIEATGRIFVPGSWWPMMLILGKFAVRYVVRC